MNHYCIFTLQGFGKVKLEYDLPKVGITCSMAVCAMTVERFGLATWTPQRKMLHIAEKGLSSMYFWVLRLMVNFLCCSNSVCKSFCRITWLCDCELLFPVPSGAVLASRQLDEILILMLLLSSLWNTISRQQWYNLFTYLFADIVFEKVSKKQCKYSCAATTENSSAGGAHGLHENVMMLKFDLIFNVNGSECLIPVWVSQEKVGNNL